MKYSHYTSIPFNIINKFLKEEVMLLHFFRIALRNMNRQKIYTFINICGLALGLTLFILIALYIQFEFSFDKFHKHYNRVCRIDQDWRDEGGGHIAFSSTPLGPTLKENYPEIIQYVRLSDMIGSQLLMVDKARRFYEEGGLWTESAFFEIFSYPLIKGNPEVALDQPFSIVLSQELAEKYFPGQDPLGQVVRFNDTHDCQVTGIIANCPKNTHIQYNFLVSYVSYKTIAGDDYFENWWRWHNNYTYALLSENASIEGINHKITDILRKHWVEEFKGFPYLNPMSRFHFYSKADMIGPKGDINKIHIFCAIGICVLLIACINYMNLATARSVKRAREIGVCKVIGATQGRLVRQFIAESVLLSYLALFLAIILSYVLLPEFNRMVGRNLSWDVLNNGMFFLGVLMIATLVGIISGSYPAFFLSALKPSHVFRQAVPTKKGDRNIRKTLVFVQFSITIILIISTLAIRKQTLYLKNRSLGYDTTPIVVMEYRRTNEASLRNYESLRQELSKHPSIQYASISRYLPTSPLPYSGLLDTWEGAGDQEHAWINTNDVDKHFLNTYGMKLIQGRNFIDEDVQNIWRCILNETAVQLFGWNVNEAVGKRVGQDFRVIGVVKDFHFKSLREKIGPLVLCPFRSRINSRDRYQLSVKLSAENIEGTLKFIGSKFKTFFPNDIFEYKFFDENLDWIYRNEEKTNKAFSYFSILTIFIACLGLFGLASFTAEQRAKEIGIRKVCGASITNILLLLSDEFVKYILLANIIAWPIAHYALQKWLQGFAYRTRIDVWIFAVSGILALIIALLTVSYQTIKAARTNPINSLKCE